MNAFRRLRLGLYISKEITENLGGNIGVINEEGKRKYVLFGLPKSEVLFKNKINVH